MGIVSRDRIEVAGEKFFNYIFMEGVSDMAIPAET